MASRCAGIVMVLVLGCSGTPSTIRRPGALGALARVSPATVEHEGVTVAAEAVTVANLAEYPQLVKAIQWVEADLGGPRQGGTTGAQVQSATQTSLVRSDKIPLASLPAFLLRFENRNSAKLDFSRAHIELTDDKGRVTAAIATSAELEAQLRVATLDRHPELASARNVQVLSSVTASVASVPLLEKSLEVPTGVGLSRFVSFRLTTSAREVAGPSTRSLRLTVRGVTADAQELPPFAFQFEVERRKRKPVKCADGTDVTASADCGTGNLSADPISGGPCIQETAVSRSWRTQQWIGESAAANSDVLRTLLDTEVSRRDAGSAWKMRWAGFSLIALGLVGGAAASVGIGVTRGSANGPIGLSVLALVPVGAALVATANRRTARAITTFNQHADATGVCEASW